jgi:hypothetical protein
MRGGEARDIEGGQNREEKEGTSPARTKAKVEKEGRVEFEGVRPGVGLCERGAARRTGGEEGRWRGMTAGESETHHQVPRLYFSRTRDTRVRSRERPKRKREVGIKGHAYREKRGLDVSFEVELKRPSISE